MNDEDREAQIVQVQLPTARSTVGRFTMIALIIGAIVLLSVPTLLMWFVLGSSGPREFHTATQEECHSLIEEVSKPTNEPQPPPMIKAVQKCLAKGLH